MNSQGRDIRLYFERQHEQLIRKIFESKSGSSVIDEARQYKPYEEPHGLLFAHLPTEGHLSTLRDAEQEMKLVLGKVFTARGKSADRNDPGTEYVIVTGHPFYREGIWFTPESDIDVKFHRKSKTADETQGYHRVELMGPSRDTVVATFPTYYQILGLGGSIPKPPLVLYRTKFHVKEK